MIDLIIKYDRLLFLAINNGLANRANDILLGGFTLAGSAHFLIPVAFLYLFMIDRERFRISIIYFILALIVGVLLVRSIKIGVGRPRPLKDMEPLILAGKIDIHNLFYPLKENSFPSGHTQLAFTIATFLAMVSRRDAFYLFLMAFLIGLSRIYVGVHYPLDVLSGAIVGSLVSFVVVKLSKIENKISKGSQL